MMNQQAAPSWMAKWLDTHFAHSPLTPPAHPMVDAVIDGIDRRKIVIGEHELIDFASCNYLGLDLNSQVQASILPLVRQWGTHPSWSRMLGTPTPYRDIERELTALTQAPDILAFPTITHIHLSVIPFLSGTGAIYLDSRAHKTIYEGCKAAQGQGATLIRFKHNDADELERLLASSSVPPRLICMDGVNSMTGNLPDLVRFAEIARRWNLILYVDDAHGFGLIGENPDGEMPWGYKGNGIVRHYGLSYDNILLVAGLSKSYSSLLAFMALPTVLKEMIKVAASPYLYSGPSPVASLATTLSGLAVNAQRGEELRRDLHQMCRQLLKGLADLDIFTLNNSELPIMEIPLKDPRQIMELGSYLFERGVYVTLALYPLVPKKEVGFRVQLTAANNPDQVRHLLAVLAESTTRFEFYSCTDNVNQGAG
ncbi:pyridoxal phosphate-dependent aminotransferase family protein [Yersinia nurmii]|uniref:Pyridoxal phosphate-dependent aminotransferase family protein n=1 Tax=Yersinia nurmii TaxID=685706 RepID=A0AAW7K7D5_9GAMM|nr:pyridoxal phosphate-dependent aminotransferase family protein [Yersinia nurmii]MDN0087350.1 pyridoxal phosphate-dependent aminotransferase family protein [Yersinia nurmii]